MSRPISDDDLLDLLRRTAEAVRGALDGVDDWMARGDRHDQYAIDLATDAAALAVLRDAGVGILSEESGLERADEDIVVIVDPVDGSTNAALQLPWYCTSLCAADTHGARVALVENLALGTRYEAVRGSGATRDGEALVTPAAPPVDSSIIALTGGVPPDHPGTWQFRVFGAAALDLCAVADGRFHGWLDVGAHAVWDYAAAVLICAEAGARVAELDDLPLIHRSVTDRRTAVVAGSDALFDHLLATRRAWR